MRRELGPGKGLALRHRVLKWGTEGGREVETGGQAQRAMRSIGDNVASNANDHTLISSDHISKPRVCLGKSSGTTHAGIQGLKAE